MRKLLTLFLLLIVWLPCLGQERKQDYTEQQFQSACATLFRLPLGPKSSQARKVIITWTIQSPKVDVRMGPQIMSIVTDKERQEDMSLLCAYMGGQSLAQLRNKTKGGYEAAGGKKAIATYRKIQKSNPGYSNAALEKMVQAAKNRRLGEYLKPPEE